MPKLTQLQVAKRQAQVLQVYKMQNERPDLTVAEVCELVGIPERTFYQWVRKSSGMIEALSAMLIQNQKEELYVIEANRLRMLRAMIDKFLSPLTTGPEMVRIQEYLDRRSDQLQDSHNAKPGLEQDAFEFLQQGPKLSMQKSRLASIEVREDATEGVTIDIYKDQEIIDLDSDS